MLHKYKKKCKEVIHAMHLFNNGFLFYRFLGWFFLFNGIKILIFFLNKQNNMYDVYSYGGCVWKKGESAAWFLEQK